MTKLQTAIIGAIIVASVTTPWLFQHQAQARLRDENQLLRQQAAQLKSDNEILSNRLAWKLFGEEAALRWVVSTYGQR